MSGAYNRLMLRILIASPFPAMRAGLSLFFNNPQYLIVGDAATDDQLLDLVDAQSPQMILYDLSLAQDETLDALWQLRRLHPEAAVLALSQSAADSRMMRALQAGVRGCLPCTATADELTAAVWQASNGELVLPPTATSAILQQLREGDTAGETLTAREAQVLRAVAAGQTNKAIALKLGISEHTVKFHLASAMSKLGAASRAEAVAVAFRRGLISL